MDVSQLMSSQLPQTARVQDPQRLMDQVAAGRAEEVANEFEAVFASLLLKEMRESLADGLFGEDQGDVYGGLFDLFIGQHMAESGGLGINRMVQEYLASVDGAVPQ